MACAHGVPKSLCSLLASQRERERDRGTEGWGGRREMEKKGESRREGGREGGRDVLYSENIPDHRSGEHVL